MSFGNSVLFRMTSRTLNINKSILRKSFVREIIDCNSASSGHKSCRTTSNFLNVPNQTFLHNQHDNSCKLSAYRANFYNTNAYNNNPKNIDTHVKSAKAALKKIKRKNTSSQKSKAQIKPGKDSWSVVGYSTAESYDLYNLAKRLAVQVTSFND